MYRKNRYLVLWLAMIAGFVTAPSSDAQNIPGERCNYILELSGSETGQAEAAIVPEGIGLKFRDAEPNSLYTVWVDFQSRETGELPADYPENGEGRGVAPAFASTAPVYSGMGLDPNGVITDENGNANAILLLDYNVLIAGDAPVVHEDLSMHGMNRVGGFWMRQYPSDPEVEASLQTVDPETNRPALVRSTPAGLTIVRHPDLVTHGHTPGVGDVDHFSSFKGDFPADCVLSE